MKFTMGMPLGDITAGEYQTPSAIKAIATALETAKVNAGYLTDHPAPSAEWLHNAGGQGHDALDPFTTFGFVAAATTNLMLHTNILVMPYRNPFLTAKSAATLQVISEGRLILGAGAGSQKVVIFDEALEVIRMAWAGGCVVKQGRTFNAAGNEPRPTPSVTPPIWIGGGSGKAVERAAIWGDGWSPFFSAPTMSKANQESGIHTVAQLGENIDKLNDMRANLNKTSAFDIAIGAQAKLDFKTRDSADKYLESVAELAEVGVTWVMIEPPHPSREAYIENVQWFGEEIIARI
jgi:hypothetical protein